MPRLDFPRTILDFQEWFPDDASCWDYLVACRWAEGYRCPRCGHARASMVASRRLWQCCACRYQTSVTAGTVLHRSHKPLHVWFWAAYLVATATPGISATQLQRQLGLTRHETAWMMLHKLRRAMVNPEREPLTGLVEVDECYVGGHDRGVRGGRGDVGDKALVLVAVEVRGTRSGRVRMQTIEDASGPTLSQAIAQIAAEGSTIRTDGWRGYLPLPRQGFVHQPRSQRAAIALGDDPGQLLPYVHRAISNLKSWLQGTHRGVTIEHLPAYLDEYCFRFNRRHTPMAAFQTLLGLGSKMPPTTYQQISATGPQAEADLAESTG